MDLAGLTIWIVAFIFALSFHEMAHAWAADRLGDPTARLEGRLTMNPIVHIDPFMTIVFPALLYYATGMMFGAAKPVPVNTLNLANPKRDHMWIAAAGPLSNVILAVLMLVLINLFWQPMQVAAAMGAAWPQPVYALLQISLFVNLLLATFNLIPIHPLDGSWILSRFLTGSVAEAYASLRPYGFFILIVLMYTGALWRFLNPVLQFASRFLPA